MNSKNAERLDDMKKLLEENPDDFLNYLKECKEKRYENKGQTIKEFLETGILYDHNLEAFQMKKIKFIGIELDDNYFNIGAERMKNHIKN